MWRSLVSARLAAWLIGAQVAFLLVAYSIPQRGIFPDDQVAAFMADMPAAIAWLVRVLSLDHTFTSVLFYASACLLAVNLVACTWQRVARRIKRRSPKTEAAIPASARTFAIADPQATEAALEVLGAYADASDAGRWFYLRRGDWGFVGSVVMHVALVLILVGGVLTGLTTFRGEMLLTEGQTAADVPEGYLSVSQVPLVGAGFRDFEVTLESMEFTYEEGSVVDAVANMRVTDDAGSREGRARVNYPLKAHGKSFLLQEAGHSVWITVEDAAGTSLVDSFFTLADVSELGYRDSLSIGDNQLFVVSRPDVGQPLSEPVSSGLLLTSPVVGLSLTQTDGPDGYEWVTPGSGAVNLDGYLVTVNEVRIWNSFLVRADGGRYVMYVAFFLVIAGAVARFIDPDRWLRCAIVDGEDGSSIFIWGAERYRAGALPREGRRFIQSLLTTGGAVDDGERMQQDLENRPSEEVRDDG